MKPVTALNDSDPDLKSKSVHQEDTISGVACPWGKVPILRNYGRATVSRSFRMLNGYDDPSTLHTVMVATSPATVYGFKAAVTVYEPNVGTGNPPRYSGAVIQIQNGILPNISRIYAGWMVDPQLYGDNHANLEFAWADNGHGCANLLCKGFVQVSSRIAPGSIISPVSTIKGAQFVIIVSVFQDANNGNWWLTYGDDGHTRDAIRQALFLPKMTGSISTLEELVAQHGGSGKKPRDVQGHMNPCRPWKHKEPVARDKTRLLALEELAAASTSCSLSPQ
ncbi:hypothetical protein EJB05_35083, partial [Eragrostis curvula]